MKLTTHLQLLLRSRKVGSIYSLPYTSSWQSAELVKYRTTLPWIHCIWTNEKNCVSSHRCTWWTHLIRNEFAIKRSNYAHHKPNTRIISEGKLIFSGWCRPSTSGFSVFQRLFNISTEHWAKLGALGPSSFEIISTTGQLCTPINSWWWRFTVFIAGAPMLVLFSHVTILSQSLLSQQKP
jgi:hypothetical protein